MAWQKKVDSQQPVLLRLFSVYGRCGFDQNADISVFVYRLTTNSQCPDSSVPATRIGLEPGVQVHGLNLEESDDQACRDADAAAECDAKAGKIASPPLKSAFTDCSAWGSVIFHADHSQLLDPQRIKSN
jgi:hypothetical protein